MGSLDPDLPLLERMLAGDKRAEHPFFERMQTHIQVVIAPWVVRSTRTGTSVSQDVEDVVQMTLLTLIESDRKKLRAYRAERGLSVRGWVKLIAYRTFVSSMRRSGNRLLKLDEEAVFRELSKDSPVDQRVEALRAIARLVAGVSDQDRLIMAMLGEGLTTAEIADVLELGEEAASSAVARLRGRLRKVLRGGDGQ